MRILHIITSLRTGGAERLMVDLLPRLQERGHDVSLLTFDGTRTPFYSELESKGISIYKLAIGPRAMHNPLLLFRLKTFLRNHHFDIIHTHNTPCQLLTALAISDSRRLVTTEHNTDNRRRRWNWYRGIDRWMYGKYSRVVCVSGEVRDNLIAALGRQQIESKISVVCNGIDTAKYINAKPSPELAQSYEAKHLVAMVAAFRPQKDQDTLIRAMALLPADYSLLLVGDGERRPECEALAGSLGLGARVAFAGIRTDIPSILASAQVVVMSSHYEGLSLSSIEGMASGRPFIASDVDGLREIVSGAGLLFPHGDAEALSLLIRRCCDDKDWAAQVARSCRDRALQYDIDKTVEGYENIIKTI